MSETLAARLGALCDEAEKFYEGKGLPKGKAWISTEKLRALLADYAKGKPEAADMKAIMAGNGHPDEGPCVVCGHVFDAHEPDCVFEAAETTELRERVAQLEKAIDDYYQDRIGAKQLWAIRRAAPAPDGGLREAWLNLAKYARLYMVKAHPHKHADYACSDGCQCGYCKAKRDLENALVVSEHAALRPTRKEGSA
jgi:hypothetical protein